MADKRQAFPRELFLVGALFIFAQVAILYMIATGQGPDMTIWQNKLFAYTILPFTVAGCGLMDIVIGMLVWGWVRGK